MISYQNHNSLGNHSYNIFIYDDFRYNHHFHKNFEIVYVMDGEIEVQIDEKMFNAGKGEFILILPNSVHYFHTHSYSRAWVGVFSKDFVNDFANTIKGKTNKVNTFRCTDNEMQFLQEFLIHDKENDLFTMKAGLYLLCSRYLKTAELTDQSSSNTDIAHKIIEYTEENFSKNITLSDIADELGYEYHYISRCFRNIFHMNFKVFLNQYRFEYAKNLIINTDKSLTTIALESGFGSIRNFNRIYKEFGNITPKNQRNNNK